MRDLRSQRLTCSRWRWWPAVLLAGLAGCAPAPRPRAAPPPERAAASRPPPRPPAVESASPQVEAGRPPVAAGITVEAAADPPAPRPRDVAAERAAYGSAGAPAHAVTDASPSLLCDLTGTRLPAAACAELREQNGLTRAGVDAAPTSVRMKLHETITYSYSIGAVGSDAAVRANVAGDAVPITSGRVELGHFNYARLTGDDGIAIKPLDDEVQDTRANPTPTWRWALTANSAGAHRLKLEAGVELRADGAPPVRLGENAKRIDVAVVVAGMARIKEVADNADTIMGISTSLLKKLALLFAAVGGALAAYRALRNRPKAAPDA